MRTTLVLAAVLLTAGLSGCIANSSDQEPTETASTDAPDLSVSGDPLPVLASGETAPAYLKFNNCVEHLGIFPVPMAAADPLPEGFTHVAFDEAGQMATMLAISYSCILSVDIDTDTFDVDIETVDEMYGMWAVEPPAEYKVGGADTLYTVLFGGFTSEEVFSDVYDAWGVGQGIEAGDVSLQQMGGVTASPFAGQRGGHALGTDGDVTVHVYTQVAGTEGEQAAGAARVFSVADGELAGVMDVSWTESLQIASGGAVIQIEGLDDPVATVFGAAQPGLGMHNWGKDYSLTLSYVDLASLAGTSSEGSE